jgi:hypothetical protein
LLFCKMKMAFHNDIISLFLPRPRSTAQESARKMGSQPWRPTAKARDHHDWGGVRRPLKTIGRQ